eukprot:GEMP01035373.1.p1 GENE.GEMP01035373.1~~GEMP01035373.1.p1  ORF type:complete len:459 (-),score=144.35 GEMP01035373.1:557-1933(-)
MASAAVANPPPGTTPAPLLVVTDARAKEINPSNELRIMVNEDQNASVKILGDAPKRKDIMARSAEIFGAELVMGLEYPLAPGTRTAIFTWHGCTVQVTGTTAQEYDAPNTMMKDYVNCAAILERKRMRADEFSAPAPRCLVVGSASSGKSTFCQILVNYALRRERYPIFVDLDPRYSGGAKSTAGLPACITAVSTAQDNLEEEESRNRIAFFFGYHDWTDNPRLYEKLVLRLARCVDVKLNVTSSEEAKRVSQSGCIINAPHAPTLGLVQHLVNEFNIDVVFVLDNESLVAQLHKEYPGVESSIEVVPLQKSGGVVQVTPQRLRFLRTQRISQYFYGPKRDLQPATLTLHLTDLCLLVLDSSTASATMLPHGQQDSKMDDVQAVPYAGPIDHLRYTLVAVMRAEKESDVPNSCVAGFCLVVHVDESTIQLLCPGAGPLPSPYLLVGDVRNITFDPREL